MLVKNKSLLSKFIRTSPWVISPFFTLILLTPLTKIPVYCNLWCIVLGTLLSLIISLRVHNDLAIIQFQNKTAFLSQLNTRLHEIGYAQDTPEETKIAYLGTPRVSLFAGDIEVIINLNQAFITAPKVYLKKLIKLLSLTQIHPVPDSLEAPPELLTKFCPVFHHCPDPQANRPKRSV